MLETAVLTAWPAFQRGGPWVLLALVVYLLIVGRLVTGRAHDRALAEQQRAHDGRVRDLAEGHNERVTDLRATIAAQQETIDVLLRQKDDLLAGARISAKALDSIRRQAELGGDSDAMAA